MPGKRSYVVTVHAGAKKVTVEGGSKETKASWKPDAEGKAVVVQVTEDGERKAPIVIRCDL